MLRIILAFVASWGKTVFVVVIVPTLNERKQRFSDLSAYHQSDKVA